MPSDERAKETLAERTGIHRSQFNEHSEAPYLTASFVFDSAAHFSGTHSGPSMSVSPARR